MWEMQRIDFSEGQVEHALKLFCGRQLCDTVGLDEDQAWDYVNANLAELEEHLAESVEVFYAINTPEAEEETEEETHEELADRSADEPKVLRLPQAEAEVENRKVTASWSVADLVEEWDCTPDQASAFLEKHETTLEYDMRAAGHVYIEEYSGWEERG